MHDSSTFTCSRATSLEHTHEHKSGQGVAKKASRGYCRQSVKRKSLDPPTFSRAGSFNASVVRHAARAISVGKVGRPRADRRVVRIDHAESFHSNSSSFLSKLHANMLDSFIKRTTPTHDPVVSKQNHSISTLHSSRHDVSQPHYPGNILIRLVRRQVKWPVRSSVPEHQARFAHRASRIHLNKRRVKCLSEWLETQDSETSKANGLAAVENQSCR